LYLQTTIKDLERGGTEIEKTFCTEGSAKAVPQQSTALTF